MSIKLSYVLCLMSNILKIPCYNVQLILFTSLYRIILRVVYIDVKFTVVWISCVEVLLHALQALCTSIVV